MEDDRNEKCPDSGYCHHDCGDGPCFRVLHAEPLSVAMYPGDRWPAEIKAEHQARASGSEAPSEEPPPSQIQAAADAGCELAAERLEQGPGVKVLAAIMLIHAEGVTPNAGIGVHLDEAEGPQDPDDVLAFLLSGASAYARANGLPFAIAHAGEG